MYSIKEAAARSGVTIATLRAWERRYGVVSPARTAGGYRLYDDEAIARLRRMRRLLDSGWRAREAAAEIVAGGSGPLTETDTSGDTSQPGANGLEAANAVDDFLAASIPFHSAGIEAVLDETFARWPFESAMERVVFPALREVGRGWEAGQVDVAAEHAASHAVLRRLAMLFEAAGSPVDRPDLVIGLPPHARHELGALAFAVAARRRGIGVLYIGADVPVSSWLATLRETAAKVAAIAVPTAADVSAAEAVVDAVAASAPSVTVALGARSAREVDDAGRPAVVLLPEGLAAAAEAIKQQLSRA